MSIQFLIHDSQIWSRPLAFTLTNQRTLTKIFALTGKASPSPKACKGRTYLRLPISPAEIASKPHIITTFEKGPGDASATHCIWGRTVRRALDEVVKVLLVDDEPRNLDALESILESSD